jgi:predicted RNA-binding Zn-ribbon protein involved in translation (DUF1610 family)
MSATATAPIVRCGKCRDHLDPEDLFCPNCGHEAPARPGEVYEPGGRIEVHRFECTGCGATLTWAVEAQGLRCSFCGRASLQEKPPLSVPAPDLVIPFRIDRAGAEEIFRTWLGRGTFRPGDLRHASALTEMRGVYLPWWCFTVECRAWWTADSNETPVFARAGWAPKFGGHEKRYEGLIVPASGALTRMEIQALGSYELDDAVPFAPEALEDYPAEVFAVTRKQARLHAGAGFEELLKRDCRTRVPGSRHRNLKLNPLFTGTTASPVLLPVWIMAYEYGGRPYRFLVNGQTGQADGTAPVSPWKIAALVLLAAALVVLLGLLAAR